MTLVGNSAIKEDNDDIIMVNVILYQRLLLILWSFPFQLNSQ